MSVRPIKKVGEGKISPLPTFLSCTAEEEVPWASAQTQEVQRPKKGYVPQAGAFTPYLSVGRNERAAPFYLHNIPQACDQSTSWPGGLCDFPSMDGWSSWGSSSDLNFLCRSLISSCSACTSEV